jgi:uncharacterized protein (TIGR00369 family)
MCDGANAATEDALSIASGGFDRAIGPLSALAPDDADDSARFVFIVTDKHMNAAGSVHGGMLMSFMDVAMREAARGTGEAQDVSAVSLNCDFVGPGRFGDRIEARVRVTRRTRTMVFLSGELLGPDDRTLLVATGLWKINAGT